MKRTVALSHTLLRLVCGASEARSKLPRRFGSSGRAQARGEYVVRRLVSVWSLFAGWGGPKGCSSSREKETCLTTTTSERDPPCVKEEQQEEQEEETEEKAQEEADGEEEEAAEEGGGGEVMNTRPSWTPITSFPPAVGSEAGGCTS